MCFFSCNSLSNLNVGGKFGKNTGNVNDMSYMFNGLISMYKISGLEDLNTSSVVNMDHMFNGDYNLQEVDVSNFNTNKVTNMQNMFSYNISLNKLNLSSFDTSSVQNMNDMLSYTLGVLVSDEKGNLFYAPGIQTLMLGSKTTLYPEVSLAEIIPKDVNNASNKYSGKWQYIQNNLPSGPIYSSSSLTNSKFMHQVRTYGKKTIQI
nr:BspA family leucine-rich repeat surface protein [Apilactobacillus ozensis]